MEIPSTVKWIIGISLFRIIIVAVIGFVAIITLWIQPETGVLTGALEAVLESLELESSDPGYAVGYIFSTYFILMIPVFFEYRFSKKQKRTGFWIAFGFDILLVAANGGFPFIALIIFILGISKKTRLYFAGKLQETPHEVLDGNL